MQSMARLPSDHRIDLELPGTVGVVGGDKTVQCSVSLTWGPGGVESGRDRECEVGLSGSAPSKALESERD